MFVLFASTIDVKLSKKLLISLWSLK